MAIDVYADLYRDDYGDEDVPGGGSTADVEVDALAGGQKTAASGSEAEVEVKQVSGEALDIPRSTNINQLSITYLGL